MSGEKEEDWKQEAREEQQEYFTLLGNRLWDEISPGESTILMQKVGYGLYGPPSELPTDDNKNTGYSGEKLECVESLTNKLVQRFEFTSEGIHFACVFIIARIDDKNHTLPIFKAKSVKSDSSCIFVDPWSRVYDSWSDWLEHEKLPKCSYCTPSNGCYTANSANDVELSFYESRACKTVSKVVDILDITSTVVSVGATVLGVTSLFVPVAGPILFGIAITAGTTGAYGVGRSTYELVDRGKHGQSIGLGDREARGHWLSIVGSSVGAGLGLAQGRLIASMSASARAGEVMGRAGRIAFAAAQIGSLTINGLGIAHGLENLIHKRKKGELTPLDVFQFTASVLFFTNSAINFKTAGGIIKQVQEDFLDQTRAGMSPEARKLFNQQTSKFRGPGTMHGNARLIKTLNNIKNVQQLYEMMVDKNIDPSKVEMVVYKESNPNTHFESAEQANGREINRKEVNLSLDGDHATFEFRHSAWGSLAVETSTRAENGGTSILVGLGAVIGFPLLAKVEFGNGTAELGLRGAGINIQLRFQLKSRTSNKNSRKTQKHGQEGGAEMASVQDRALDISVGQNQVEVYTHCPWKT